MFNIGTTELIIIFLIILLLFGAKNIPEIAKGIGKSISSFKKGLKDIKEDVEQNQEDKKT